MTCTACSTPLAPEAKFCTTCGAPRSAATVAPARVAPPPPATRSLADPQTEAYTPAIQARVDGLGTRYRDAYLVAEGLDRKGQAYKTLGVVVGLAGCLLLLLALGNLDNIQGMEGLVIGAGGFLLSLAILGSGLRLYGSGVALAAQGQMMMATLDTAVHTSPFFSPEQMLALVSRG